MQSKVLIGSDDEEGKEFLWEVKRLSATDLRRRRTGHRKRIENERNERKVDWAERLAGLKSERMGLAMRR